MNKDSYMNRGLITSSAAITEQLMFGNLMDMIKIEKQRNMDSSYYQITKNYCKKGVLNGMMKGFFPWGVLMYGSRGLLYGSFFELSKNKLQKNTKYENHNINIIASFNAGAIEGFITTPFVFMRTNVAQIANTNIKSYNYSGLLKTIPINSIKRGSDWALRTYLYQEIKKKDVNPLVSGFLSGIISGIITTPIDRFIPLIQQSNPPPNLLRYYTTNIRKQGLKTIFTGNSMRLLHCGWHTCFIFGAMHIYQNELFKF